jgi:MtrB/PioB family decaheme-associated outer membrane protein
MRTFVLVILGCFLGFALPAAVQAQAADQQAQATDPQAAQQTAAQSTAVETAPRSLFEQTWHQFQFGGRVTDINGDPARFQRYQDVRDGVLFTDARYAHEETSGAWLFRAAADNVGWRDQRLFANYQRTGRLVISGMWDEIPQFYSVDTKTPYTTSVSPLLLDDTTQRQIQNGQATLNAYVPIAPQFNLIERRDIGNLSVLATPTPQLDVKAAFTTARHTGELPWGASFGFSNDVEVALPYDSRTNDFTLGTEWTNGRSMLRVAYNGSWFSNLDDTLVWDSPLRADDSTSAPGRGRTALWPSNSAQTVSAAGYAKFARRTQLTGFLSYGFWNNDEALQPFTINSALPQIALPRATAKAEAHVVSTNLNLVSRPLDDWRFSARVRRYDYGNQTPSTTITQYVSYDTSVNTSSTLGPELYAHSRTTFDADAIWNRNSPVALTVGYTHNDNGYDFRIFQSIGENVLRLSADAVGAQWITFRAQYEYGDRTGSGLDENLLVEIGEQPDMRHYDLANRTRNRFTGQVDLVPNDVWTFSASVGAGKDNYGDSSFGLQNSTFQTFSFGADFRLPNGFGGGSSYNYENYAGLQRSRSANSDQFNDPNRDWTADSTERVNYFSLYATPPKIGRNTEARLSYDFSYAEGNYLYTVVQGGPLPPPSQLPKVYSKLQQLRVEVRHRLSNRLAATLSYLYEPFRVYDFAFDQSVVDSIVQPSSLVLGYVYRPYTANSAALGLKYLW